MKCSPAVLFTRVSVSACSLTAITTSTVLPEATLYVPEPHLGEDRPRAPGDKLRSRDLISA